VDIDPATRPATPAMRTASFEAEAAATPIMRLAIDTIASSAPSTPAHSHPARPLRCVSPSSLAIRVAPRFGMSSAGTRSAHGAGGSGRIPVTVPGAAPISLPDNRADGIEQDSLVERLAQVGGDARSCDAISS
jgi:hypothetical protein